MPPLTPGHLTRHDGIDPLVRLVSSDSDRDPLELFAPETPSDRKANLCPSPAPVAPIAPPSPPQVDATAAIAAAMTEVEKRTGQHFAALDERNRLLEERLNAAETLIRDMRARAGAADDLKHKPVAKPNTTGNLARFVRSALRGPRQAAGRRLSAVGVLAVLVLIGVVVTRSPGDADQIETRAFVAEPPSTQPVARELLPAQVAASQPPPSAPPAAHEGPTVQAAASPRPPSAPPATRERPTLQAAAFRPPPALQADRPAPPQSAAPASAPPIAVRREQPPANREAVAGKRQLARTEPRSEMFAGTLTVRSNPDGGTVFLNGRSVGTTPLRLPGLRAGSYALRIERDGYQRWTAAILVPADKQTDIGATLEIQPVR